MVLLIFFCLAFIMLSIVVKLLSVYIFKHIESINQIYFYLKMRSMVDVFFLITKLFLPLAECNEPFKGCVASNYWANVYKFYINLYLNRCLKTISTLFTVLFAWNQFKQLTFTGRFKFILASSVLLAFLLHWPNFFLYKISLRSNSSSDYEVQSIPSKTNQIVTILQYVVQLAILILTLIFNVMRLIKNRNSRKIELSRAIKRRTLKIPNKKNNDQGSEFNRGLTERYTSPQDLPGTSLKMNYLTVPKSSYSKEIKLADVPKKNYEFQKTKAENVQIEISKQKQVLKQLNDFIILTFSLEIFLSTIGDGIGSFFIKTDFQFYIFIRIFYIIIISTQILHFLAYYLFNQDFAKKINIIFKRVKK